MAFTKIENDALSDNVVIDDDKITSLSASKLTGALPAIDGSALTGISIPTVPTNLSEFTNDSGYITGYTVTETDVTTHLATVASSGSYSDLTGTPALNANATAAIGLWTWGLDGDDLVFRYNGTDVFKITTAGAMIAADNVIAYGTP